MSAPRAERVYRVTEGRLVEPVAPRGPKLPPRLNRKGRRDFIRHARHIVKHLATRRGVKQHQIANPLERYLAQRNAEAMEWLIGIPEIHAMAEGE